MKSVALFDDLFLGFISNFSKITKQVDKIPKTKGPPSLSFDFLILQRQKLMYFKYPKDQNLHRNKTVFLMILQEIDDDYCGLNKRAKENLPDFLPRRLIVQRIRHYEVERLNKGSGTIIGWMAGSSFQRFRRCSKPFSKTLIDGTNRKNVQTS